jgi:hypothetical protein
MRRKSGGMKTIPAQGGRKAIRFKQGGQHATLGVPAGQKIPAAKRAAARAGKLGTKAERQELFRENVLKGRRKK